ncbi:putative ABC transporter periplasmic binding protein [Gottschalkia purinilytica]|uniref:High-affinity heme uptake system protein IsdE n=1 Tax=Gottschalkia purinilytica TaxID=1503 RepID=A0A0L0W9S6_GOTPU|nr:heme ABC transporter substrate-binding protein IsdE [Gottschalkia purinilytica]KNF08284.1 putative ABC transporter periplasmic binding protein [Gottschalkia purinilytica]
MKKILAFILTAILAISFVGCSSKESNKESDEATKTSKEEKKVVVSGTVALSQVLESLNVELAGRPTTKEPISESLKKLPEIGDPMNPDMEKIKALNPDVFVSTGALKDSLGKNLEENGIKTEFYDLNSFDGVKNTIKELSQKFDKEEEGKKILDDFNTREEKILKSIEGKEKPKVMIIFGTPGNFMLATEKSFTGDLAKKLGGENVTNAFGNAPSPYIPFNIEEALKQNPDVILRLTHVEREKSKAMFDKEFEGNKQWGNFEAVKNNKVYDLDKNYFGVTGTLKSIDALEKMSEYLYEK